MLISMWSLKGGQGTSVAAAMAAVRAAQDHGQMVRLVDLGRDQPAIFGAAVASDSWLSRWAQSGLGADALDRALVELTPNLSLLPRGDGPLNPQQAGELIEWLKADNTTTVVDASLPASISTIPSPQAFNQPTTPTQEHQHERQQRNPSSGHHLQGNQEPDRVLQRRARL